jgi:hypothetical protein
MTTTTTARHGIPATASRMPRRSHAMRYRRHSALFWAAHIGIILSIAAITIGISLFTSDREGLGRQLGVVGLLALLVSAGLAVAGARRHS